MNISRPIRDRFYERFIPCTESGCWLWLGHVKKEGYGKMGRGKRGSGVVDAHRASWEIHFGEIPAGLLVLHKCDVRCCVNPQHLFLGTQKENMIDMRLKGRNRNRSSPAGELNPRAKLTSEIVKTIRASSETNVSLGVRYKVSDALISNIRSGKIWRHV